MDPKGYTGKRNAVIHLTALLVAALVVYAATDFLLRRAMTKGIRRDSVDYSRLIDFLPPETKKEVEYRAEYLRKREHYERNEDPKLARSLAYAVAFHTRDKAERYELMSPFISPDQRGVKDAVLAYSLLLYDPAYQHPVSIDEYHEFQKFTPDFEDTLKSWQLAIDRLNAAKAPSSVFVQLLEPLLDLKNIPCRDYRNFFAALESHALRSGNPDLAWRARMVCQMIDNSVIDYSSTVYNNIKCQRARETR